MVIHKQILSFGMENHFLFPKGTKIIHYGIQHDYHYIWTEVDYSSTVIWEGRIFIIISTGAEYTKEWKYVATTFENNGESVWHLLEKVEK